jgi:hypothetical protein
LNDSIFVEIDWLWINQEGVISRRNKENTLPGRCALSNKRQSSAELQIDA